MANTKLDLKNYKIPGCVLVLNHYEFNIKGLTLDKRDGTEADVKNLKESFEDIFKFKFRVFNDLNYGEIEKILKNYADPNNSDDDREWVDLSQCGCLVIVVLTHGKQGGQVCAADSMYHISSIWKPFIKCKALDKKLLWLIFQACRTDQGNVELVATKEKILEMGPMHERANYSPSAADPSACNFLPRRQNILISFSTVEHRGSHREETGSWFISKLCNEVRSWSPEYGLMAMVKRATRNVVELGLGPNVGQTPTCTSFLASDIVNSVQKASIPLEMQHDETKSTSGLIDSTSTHPKASSSAVSKNHFFDADLIDSDASGKVNNEMPRYEWNTPYAGRAYIFYDSLHEEEAELLKSIAENKMGLRAILPKISTTDDVIKDVKSLASENNFMDESCLLVAVLAKFCEKKNLEEVCPAITRAFLSTACPSLATKPKVFIFLDKDVEENLPVNAIVSDSPDDKLNFASQHSDMIFVRAISQEFITNFLADLGSECQREDLMQIATNSIGKMKTNPYNKMLPHLESTLIKDLVFPSYPIELLNLDDLDRESENAVFEVPCENFVGRRTELKEVYDYLNSVNESKESKIVAAISGPIGIGKTQLVCKLMHDFEKNLPFQNLILIKSRKENIRRKQLASASLCKSKTLVVFEDFELSDVKDFTNLSNLPELSILILSREDCRHITLKQIKLRGLSDEDAKELCEKIHNVETGDKLMQLFTSTFHNHPLALTIMCDYTRSSAIDMDLIVDGTHDYNDTLNHFKDDKYCVFTEEHNPKKEDIDTDYYGKLTREEWDKFCKENGFEIL